MIPDTTGSATISAGQVVVRLTGPIVLSRIKAVEELISGPAQCGSLLIDLSGATALDTAGAWAIATALQKRSGDITAATPEQRTLIETVARALPAEPSAPAPDTPGHLEQIGQATIAGLRSLADITGFFGLVVARLGAAVVRPWRLRLTALVCHTEQAGLKAAPIVALMGLLIGVVLAYQGASQLEQFGAEVFVVDLIAISVFRELGILLTAIIVAGRSASAYTAAIGSMKMRQEVDAIRTLGLDPIELLVLPRVLALVIFLPILGIIADVTGLLGGAAMSWYQLGVSPGVFRTRLLEVDVSHFLVGILKAPFFALIIGVIGCFQGMRVEGNADSLGRLTSRSVVQAIFMVTLADGVFSIFFVVLGV